MKVWCDTCEGCGIVSQIDDCGKECDCPDCEGKGWWDSNKSTRKAIFSRVSAGFPEILHECDCGFDDVVYGSEYCPSCGYKLDFTKGR